MIGACGWNGWEMVDENGLIMTVMVTGEQLFEFK